MNILDDNFHSIEEVNMIDINGGVAVGVVAAVVTIVSGIVATAATLIDIPGKVRSCGYDAGFNDGQKVAIEIYNNTIEHQKKSAWYQAYYS